VADKYALRDHQTLPHYDLELRGHSTVSWHIPPVDKTIFFLRDPTSHFVSGFYSRQWFGQPRCFFPWSPAERDPPAAFETPNQLALATSSSDEQVQQRARNAMSRIQHVRHFYYHWFGDQSYVLSRLQDVLSMGLQETFSDDFEWLKAKRKLRLQ
jgi:hypothetical protein